MCLVEFYAGRVFSLHSVYYLVLFFFFFALSGCWVVSLIIMNMNETLRGLLGQ